MKKYTQEFKASILEVFLLGNNITKSCEIACKEHNIPYSDGIRRKASAWLEKNNITNNIEIETTDAFQEAKKKVFDNSKKRFIISWCQSETDINERFLKNIEAYANHIDASIHIIAGRYRNPISLSASKSLKDKEDTLQNSWHEKVLPYLDANRHKIHKHLCILSDLKIQPTASTPLSGINGLTGLESCIVGHPRVHLKSLPILDGYPHKLLLTTGSVSVENYTDTKVGKRGEFHHTFGFVVVELDGDDFHVRQVTADDNGSFYDLELFIEDGFVIRHSGAEQIVFGDLHLGETNQKVLWTSFDLADKLKCDNIVLHDAYNGHSISHHERNQPFQLLKREEDGSDSLINELDQLAEFFETYSNYNFTVVRSNHDEFLDRWLNDVDWRRSNNKMAYLQLAGLLANSKESKGVIPLYLNKVGIKNAYCLGIDESLRVKDWELGVHGHIGANGSRGSAIQYAQMNTKTVTGHTHSPIRLDGHLSVGTLTHLRVGYNKGLSSWLNSNVVIYPNGKAQHVHIINNKYTTL
jgi:hypothetical protein